MLGRASTLVRSTLSNSIRYGSHGGVPGENLPFGLHNRYRLTAWFCVFFGSGLTLPFFVVRHQLLKM
ncbi:cytochrome c oxidase subunit 7C, mitochondrial-like [Phlebotomus argentipes]|uniref:cytochrome c oxidase subunit 7C, mitochondrial-like n=1 Tax=Phlebotomus argentipes TaxID=94469 RepID=UPI002892B84F|nr:cytochrome c oxidase subunit 7C, mitochondrial-like [Phlebotomus argentipes]